MLQDDPDRDVVERIRAGNDRAFDELMARYKKPVLNFVYRILGDAHESDDVAQETFVRVYRNLPKFEFRPGAKFSTWLFQAARNAAIDHARKRHSGIFQSLENSEQEFPSPGRTAADEAVAAEIGAAVASAISALPEDQRTAIVLSEYHGQSYAEIAAVMDCSEKSVESRLYRAKQALRARLGRFLGS